MLSGLRLEQIEDPVIRDNFQILNDWVRQQELLKGEFKHFELNITAAVTNMKFKHNLGFSPKDLIQTWLTGAGAITWNYASFDKDNLDITTTGACLVRFFIGRFEKGGSNA